MLNEGGSSNEDEESQEFINFYKNPDLSSESQNEEEESEENESENEYTD